GTSVGAMLRAAPPAQIAGRAVVRASDLAIGETVFANGTREAIDLPKSDVLIYALDDQARVIVRPSGTEPKLKCYYEVRMTVAPDETMAAAEQRARHALDRLAREHGATLTT